MKKSGITRRIDELGRIVIPKEIRKNLKIRDNDELEISIQDNHIILDKYELLEQDKTINIFLQSISKITHKSILFTSKTKIIDYVLVNNDKIQDLELSNGLVNMIENRKQTFNNQSNIYLNKEKLISSYIINPLIINGDLLGSLILFSAIDNINELDQTIITFSSSFLEKYLE